MTTRPGDDPERMATGLTDQFADLALLVEEAEAGNLGEVLELLAAPTDCQDDRSTMFAVLARSRAIRDPLRLTLALQPDDVMANLLWAHSEVARAATVLAAAAPTGLTETEAAGYYDALNSAEQRLDWLLAAAPDDPHVGFLRLHTARGLGLGAQESRRRYDELCALEPDHPAGQTVHFAGLLPAWGGSQDAAADFAATLTTSLPLGSAGHGLVAISQLERWVGEHGAREVSWLSGDAVVAEVQRAAERYLGASRRQRYSWVASDTAFAVFFGLAGRPQRARQHFARLGPAISPILWSYAAAHHDVLRPLRAQVLERG